MSATTEQSPASAAFDDLLDLRPETRRCPYQAYDVQRTTAPVTYSERLGAWVVMNYDDCVDVLRDSTTYSNRLASGPSSVSGLAQQVVEDSEYPERTRNAAARRIELSRSRVLLFSDPPLHKRQRALVNAGFTPRRVASMHDAIETLVNELIDEFPSDGSSFDIVPALSHPLPMTIIARLLGVPPELLATFKQWSDAFTLGVGALDQDRDTVIDMFDKVDAFYDYFTEQLDQRRTEPLDDLLSDLLAARLDGEEPLTEAELLQMLVQFLVAGNETTTNLLTSLVRRLTTDLPLQQRLREDPAGVPAFVEEILRLESPVQGAWRIATRDVEVGGTTIPADSLIYLVIGSANRDPEAYADPDDLDLDERRARHLAFGRGEHTCLGMNLAKLEAQVAIALLLQRCGELTPADPAAEPEYHRSFVLHGTGSLPIRAAHPAEVSR